MTLQEKISVLVFLGIVGAVYLKEAHLIYKLVIDVLRHKSSVSEFFSPTAIIFHSLSALGILCFLYGYFIEPYRVELKTITIHTDKLRNTELKIVQISDLHCDKKIRNEGKLANIINPLKPDIIVFTGDSVNTEEALPRFKETLKGLQGGIGKYAIHGNWDVWFFNHLDLFSETGFKVLNKESETLTKDGEAFYLSGLKFTNTSPDYERLETIPKDKLSIFLYHTPDLIEDLNVDLYLAGHTHGGQIRLPFYGALVTLSKFGKKYEAGQFKVGKTILYVNRGIGLEGGLMPRIRFLARPEIAVFEIKPKK